MTTKDFIDIGEGCTRDPRLVTDWDGSTFYYEFSPTMGHMTPDEYEKAAAECTLLGGGWSAAEPDELLRGMDWNRVYPAVVSALAADTKTDDYYLTKCKHPADPDYVRVVCFFSGDVVSNLRTDCGYVRLVRRLYVVKPGEAK